MKQVVSDWERGSLIPPRRLGAALSEARADRGLTLEELAARSDGRFTLSMLASIERGSREVSDDDARALAGIYALDATSLVPPRSKLVIDLDEGLLAIDDRRTQLSRSAPARDEVLSRYLTMVYSMRCQEPGTPLTLRVDDLEVLGRVMRVGSRMLEADLDALMSNPGDLIGWRLRVLRRRVLIPAAGVLVASLGVGALVLVQGQQPANADVSDAPTAQPSTGVQIGSAVVQERAADGSPGPVVIRTAP